MVAQRFTVTLPEHAGKLLREQAKHQKKPLSRVIAEALEAQERERIRELMIEGYKECAEFNRKLAEEFWPIAAETWPDD